MRGGGGLRVASESELLIPSLWNFDGPELQLTSLYTPPLYGTSGSITQGGGTAYLSMLYRNVAARCRPTPLHTRQSLLLSDSSLKWCNLSLFTKHTPHSLLLSSYSPPIPFPPLSPSLKDVRTYVRMQNAYAHAHTHMYTSTSKQYVVGSNPT